MRRPLLVCMLLFVTLLLTGCPFGGGDPIPPEQAINLQDHSVIRTPHSMVEGGSFILAIDFIASQDLQTSQARSVLPDSRLFQAQFPLNIVLDGKGWKVTPLSTVGPFSCSHTESTDKTTCSAPQMNMDNLGVDQRWQMSSRGEPSVAYFVVTAPFLPDGASATQLGFKYTLDLNALTQISSRIRLTNNGIYDSEARDGKRNINIVPIDLSVQQPSEAKVGQPGHVITENLLFTAGGAVVTDPSELYLAVLYDASHVSLDENSLPAFFTEMDYGTVPKGNIDPANSYGARYAGPYVPDGANGVELPETSTCDSGLPVPATGYCWKIFSTPMRNIASDTVTGTNNYPIATFGGDMDIAFQVIPGSGKTESTAYYYWGLSPVADAIDTQGGATVQATLRLGSQSGQQEFLLDVHDKIERTIRTDSFNAYCTAMTGPQELYPGQVGSYELQFKQPPNTDGWGGDDIVFAARVSPSGAAGLPTGWGGPLTVPASEAGTGTVELTGPIEFRSGTTELSLFYSRNIYYQLYNNATNEWYGEPCSVRISVRNKVLPGWRLASGNNYIGGPLTFAIEGITVNGDSVTLPRDTGIVSEGIRISNNQRGTYEARVRASGADCNLDLEVIYYTSGVRWNVGPPGAAAQENNGVYTITREVTSTSSQVGLLIHSKAAATGECTVHEAGLYRIEEERFEPDDFYGEHASPVGCCPTDYCWSGNSCVASGDFHPISDARLACQQGTWIPTVPKENPFGTEQGDCISGNTCYLRQENGSSLCVNDGYYARDDDTGSLPKDHYCMGGEWTSRATYVFRQLQEIGDRSGDEYTVACGAPYEMINEVYSTFSSNQRDVFGEVMKCDDTSETCDHVSQVCVLTAGDTKVLGLVSDVPIDKRYNVRTGGSPLYAVAQDHTYCTGAAANTGNEFAQCNGQKAYYNAKINAIIMSNATFNLGTSVDVTDTRYPWMDARMGQIVQDPVNPRSPGFVNRLHTFMDNQQPVYGMQNLGFVKDFSRFDKVYFTVKNKGARDEKSVFGIWGAYAKHAALSGSPLTSGDPSAGMVVQYRGFGENVCSFLNFSVATSGVCADRRSDGSTGSCCFVDGNSPYAYVVSEVDDHELAETIADEKQGAFGRENAYNRQKKELLFTFFPDLTWKLRLE